jgi:hypothetical protein
MQAKMAQDKRMRVGARKNFAYRKLKLVLAGKAGFSW